MSTIAPKRIVLIGPFHPYRGGIVHFLETMYRGLKQRGHQVGALTFFRQYPDLLFPGKTQYASEQVNDPVTGPRHLDTINPLTWRRVARWVKAQGYEVAIFKYWMPFFAPAFGTITRYLRKHGVKVVVVVDNAIPHERRPGDLWLSCYFLRAVSGCIVMSESVETDLRRLRVSAPVRRIAHPIYNIFGTPIPKKEAREALNLPLEKPVLLFFGFIRRYKGLLVLLQSMPRVIEHLPDVRLIVAGEFYEDDTPYQSLIQSHGLQEYVTLHAEYIPNVRVPVYFSAADVVVQPYLTATQSGVAQVAFQFDKPLIVTAVGGLPEVVPDGKAGLVVPPDNPEALAEAIIRYFREDMGEELKNGVQKEKKKYSWDRLYEAFEAMI